MNDQKEFLATEPIGKLLFKLSVPTVIAQLINMLYNVVDRIYIGHMPGDGSLALTGVGVCMPIIMIVSAFAALVSSGGAPRASIFMGEQDNQSAEKTLGNCFKLQIIVSVILTAILLIWSKDLLLAFGASGNTIEYANSYMQIYAMGTIFVQLTLGMNTFITAQGFTKISMISVVIGAVCNIVLDPVFIFGLNMGVRGAALATIISQMVSCIWIISFLCGKKTTLRIKKENLKLQKDIILPCIALGTAAFVMQSSESVISVCFNSSLLKYGGDIAVGAMTIMTSVMQFAMLPLQGIAQGAQPVTSYNFGAKNADRVKKTFRLLLITCLSYSLLLWAAVMAAPHIFVRIFTSDANLAAFAAPMLRIYLGGLGIFGIQIACQMTFTSLGKAANSIVVAVVRKFVLLLPLIYIMPTILDNKTQAVYMAEPVADVIAVTFTAILFAFQFKKAMKEISSCTQGNNMLNKLLKSVLDQDRAPIVVCNTDDIIVYMNPSAKSAYHKDLTGSNIKDCHPKEANEKIDKVIRWFMESAENNIIYTYHNDKENKDVYMVALRDEEHTLIGYYEKHEYRNRETANFYDWRK